jgi:hypothetical protein
MTRPPRSSASKFPCNSSRLPASWDTLLQNFDPRKTPSVSTVWSLEKDIWNEFFDSTAMRLRTADLEKASTACTD